MDAGQPQRQAIPPDALRQPLRIRILEICTEWERISPSEIVDLGLCADIESIRGKTRDQALTNIAYHCRKLAKFGFLTVVEREPVRGSTKHYYSATVEAKFEGDEWSSKDKPEREDFSQVAWQRFAAQVEGSMEQRIFDARTDRWQAWGPLELDEHGYLELMDEFDEFFRDIPRIKEQAAARLAASGEAPMHVTYGLFGFESPRLPTRPKAKRQHRSRK